jgi:hypothetical protein
MRLKRLRQLGQRDRQRDVGSRAGLLVDVVKCWGSS